MTDEERKTEELLQELREGFARAGLGRASTEAERRASEIRMNKRMRQIERRVAFFDKLGSALRTIFYTPLSIAFHLISFLAKGIGYVSSLGLIAGVYYAYKSIVALVDGVPFAEVDTFWKALALLLIPFIAFGISVVTEHIYTYFEDNAF